MSTSAIDSDIEIQSETLREEPEVIDVTETIHGASVSNHYGESVFDHTAMAPLSPASAVSESE
jgi:hypothetical protein